MKCYNAQTFFESQKMPSKKLPLDLVIIKKHKRRFTKTRSNLKTITYAEPPPTRPTALTSFPKDASNRRMKCDWFKKHSWLEDCLSLCKMKYWICRSYFMNLSFKDGIIAKNQDTFASVSYHDNKHATRAFVSYENSKLHVACMELHQASISN